MIENIAKRSIPSILNPQSSILNPSLKESSDRLPTFPSIEAPIIPVITIDGPSGVGKGTVGLMLASKLQWHFLDSGAIYRVLALVAARAGVDFSDEAGLTQLAERLPLAFKVTAQDVIVMLDHQDVSLDIRTEAVSQGASKVAVFPLVRRALLECQRQFQQPPGLIADGRDMGTIVFPDAWLKFYLTASVEERAIRRQKQLMNQGIDVKLPALMGELSKRDERDSTRSVSPLLPAQDAIIVDTTNQSIENVMGQVWEKVCQKQSSMI